MGKATVRLATNGARLTNCSILGAAVIAGEKVIVDYSAEGPPIVRPYTILGAELDEVIEDEEKEPDPPQFVYGKFTSTINKVDPGTYDIIWDTAIMDTWGMLNAPNTDINLPLGNFVVNITVGAKTGIDYPNFTLSARMRYSATAYMLGYNNFRRSWYSDGHHLVVHQSGTYKTVWDTHHFSVRVSSAQHTLAYVEGRYPLLEVYRIAEIGPHKTNMHWWSWNEYDFPGQ
jgi:hypothetical protein